MATNTDPQKIDRLLSRHVLEVIGEEDLRKKLASGEHLRVKFGADPSRPDLHLGHAINLKKLRAFQELGHTVVFIIGDYTAAVGDPSGKSKTRPVLSQEEIKANAQTYFEQAGKILDMDKIELHYNSEWFAKMSFLEVIGLAAKFTVARMIERDDFSKRLEEGTDVHLHELLYPMMQAYDSVELKADLEIGASDQRFNILAGRELQKKLGQPEQSCLFVGPILVGTDGSRKMSKSYDNYVGLGHSADEMFGRTMSIPDDVMWNWFVMTTELPEDEIAEMKKACEAGKMNPRDAKVRLAKEIITEYHSAEAADEAEANFVAMFQKKEVPDEMEEFAVSEDTTFAQVMVDSGLVASKSEARRLIEQGGVKIDGEVVNDPNAPVEIAGDSSVLQKGKRFFRRLVRKQ